MRTIPIPVTYVDGSTGIIDVDFFDNRLTICGIEMMAEMDLAPLSGLLELQHLEISGNYGLENLDLTPLANLRNLQLLDISGNKLLTSIDLTPLCRLTRREYLDVGEEGKIESVGCLFSRITIESVALFVARSVHPFRITFTLTRLRSILQIVQLIPLVKRFEEPWKMNHLIQSTLEIVGLGFLGMLDIDSDTFVQVMKQWEETDFKEIAREAFISHWIRQVEAGGTT